jgi:prefoldin subunit 5
VLDSRSRPPGGRPIYRRVTLLALLMLAAVPAAAEAKNFNVDGRVKGAPTAKGGAVTVPLQLTRAAGNKLRLGTRNVSVKIKRRARLRLSGSGAQGATRLRAAGLRAGDRVKGVTSLSRKAKRRMRYTARPTLKLKRVRVIRNARRLAPPGPPAAAAPRTFEQVLAELPGRVLALNAKVGEFGSLPQQIEAQKLQLESLGTGLEGVTMAFETLTTNVESNPGFELDPGFEALLLQVEALVARVELLEGSTTAVEDALGQLESGIGTIGGALEQLTIMAPLLASQAALIKSFPGAEAQVMAIDETLRRIESRLAAAEGAIGNIGGNVGALNAQMASLAAQVNAVAAGAASNPLPTVQAGVNGLVGGVGSLESAFAGFGSLGGVATELVGLEADAIALEGMVEALCTSVPTACP